MQGYSEGAMASIVPAGNARKGNGPRASADPSISVRCLMDWLEKWLKTQFTTDLWHLFARLRKEVGPHHCILLIHIAPDRSLQIHTRSFHIARLFTATHIIESDANDIIPHMHTSMKHIHADEPYSQRVRVANVPYMFYT